MNAQSSELETLQNCLQVYPYQPQSLQSQYGTCLQAYPYQQLAEFELSITQTSIEGEPLLNYGAKLRLLIADPIKGSDLREAISKLKTALKEAYRR